MGIRAFIDTIEDKESAIRRAENARENDLYHAAGQYWADGKGSVLGVMYKDHIKPPLTLHQMPHAAPHVHGIPVSVAYMIDALFSRLSMERNNDSYKRWAERVFNAIPNGADLSSVPQRMALHVLETPSLLSEHADERGSMYCGMLLVMYQNHVNGTDMTDSLKNLYDKINQHHHHIFAGRSGEKAVMSACRNLCRVLDNYSWSWLLSHLSDVYAGDPRKLNKKTENLSAECAKYYSDKFIQMIGES